MRKGGSANSEIPDKEGYGGQSMAVSADKGRKEGEDPPNLLLI